MKPVYAMVTVQNGDRETTVEGWLFETHTTFVDQEGNKIDDGLGISIQPSLDFVEGGLVLTLLFKDIISIMPTQPIYTETVPIVDGQNIVAGNNGLDTLW